MCGTHLETGEQYLIFAYQNKDGQYMTGLCMGNKLAIGASEEIEILNKISAQPNYTAVWIFVIATVIILGAIYLGTLRRD